MALARAAQAIRSTKGKGDRARPVTAPGIIAPTDQQRGNFTDRPVTVKTERGVPVGRAYRRQPYFETLAKLPLNRRDQKGARMIDADQLRAARVYRDAWEKTQASETRCALAVDDIGGGTFGHRIPTFVWTDDRVRAADRAMGALGETVRAVLLHDQSLAGVAIGRWGSRQRQRLVGSRIVDEIVPKEEGHTDVIKDEFLRGMTLLAASIRA